MAFSYKEIGNLLSKWASCDASSHLTNPTSFGSPGKFVVRCHNESSYSSLSTSTKSDLKSTFMKVYDSIKSNLLHDSSFEFDDDSRQWVEWMMDYNVPGGKKIRGLTLVESYQVFKNEKLTNDELFLACVLGWCIEWFQAYILIVDDIMDGSHRRRGRSCWFRLPEVGMVAVNDAVLLRNHIFKILKKHFYEKAYYVDLLELFNEVDYQTVSGQMIDVTTKRFGEKHLSKYTMSNFQRIAQYKATYYTLYLPVACGLLMSGENLDDHLQIKDIFVKMAFYAQMQDDYLDTFGDPNVDGKTGEDIENSKCSWLVAKALELANEEQKRILCDNYGIKDPVKVAKVEELYRTLNLQAVFEDYENKSHAELIQSIAALPSKPMQAVVNSLLRKLYLVGPSS